jgi:acetyltransferase-like isoleucine patch superfamily enzyme
LDTKDMDTTESNAAIHPDATVGYNYQENAAPVQIGEDAIVRSGTVIYQDVTIGDSFMTGHNVLIRENMTIGDDVLVGTNTVIDGSSSIGSHVSFQTGVYVPSETTIGNNVFLGPHAVLTNDSYPIRQSANIEGPTIKEGVSIGANATVLPGITIGKNAFVAAGAVVTEDIPPDTLAVGVPAAHRPLPTELVGGNQLAE